MSSRRCSICDSEWPCTDAFKSCPECGEDTWVNRDAKPNRTIGVPSVPERMPPYRIDQEARQFRAWLDTVTADDFRVGL